MNKRWCAVLICLAALLPNGAFAGGPDLQLTPEGRIFANFHYNLSAYPAWDDRAANNGFSEFEITRAYLGLGAKLGEMWSARVVGDVARQDVTKVEPQYATDENGDQVLDADGNPTVTDVEVSTKKGPYLYYLKYAYGDFQPGSAFALRLGMAPTAFTDKYDGGAGWGYRFVQSSPVDRAKWESSADLGLAVFGAFPRGFGDYYAMFRNGEGYKEPEANQGKAGQARVSVAPLAMFDAVKTAQLTLAYKYDVDQLQQAGTPRILTELGDVLLTFPIRINDDFGLNFGGGFDWLQTTTDDGQTSTVVVGNLFHGYLTIDLPYHLGVFARVDRLDPDAKNDKETHGYQDEQTFAVAGVSVRPIKNAAFALDYQTTRYAEQVADDQGKEVDKPTDSYVYLNAEFKF